MSYRVPFIDYSKQYHNIKAEIDEAYFRCMENGDFIFRQDTVDFENNLAKLVGRKYGISTGSGTNALFLSMYAYGIGKGHEVITVDHTYIATIDTIIRVGAKPVLIDVREDFNINPKLIEQAITERTKAIIPVHLNGRSCEMDLIKNISDKFNLIIIEDTCFSNDTEIITDNGIKQIDTIEIGDQVFSNNGRFNKVTNIFKHKYVGDIISIKTWYYNKTIDVTPNHRFLAIKNPKTSNLVWNRHVISRTKPEWICVNELVDGDYIVFPKYANTDNNVKKLEWETKNTVKTTKIETIEISKDVMRFFGYYVAEGCWGGINCQLYFHEDEKYIIDDVCKLIELFHRKPFISKDKRSKCICVKFTAKELKQHFYNMFGDNANRKKIPSWFYDMPNDYLIEFLKGLFLGDGNFTNNRIIYATVSKQLAHQIRFILIKLGIISGLYRQTGGNCSNIGERIIKNNGCWVLKIQGNQLSSLLELFDLDDNNKHRHEFAIKNDNYILIPIKSVLKKYFDNYVYNIEVSNEHNYCLPIGCVHNCQSIGSKYKGIMTGSIGDTTCHSFYPAKLLGSYGEGGAICTDDKQIASKLYRLRDHGENPSYLRDKSMNGNDIKFWGFNSLLDNLQAAFLNVKLKHLNEYIERRREIALMYEKDLFGVGDLALPYPPNDGDYFDVYQNYVVLTKSRNALARFLNESGIETLIKWYPANYKMSGLKEIYNKFYLPVTDMISQECLSLPIYPELDDWQVEYVISKVREFFGE